MIGKRVVVTGIAAVTPLGNTIEETWEGILTGRSGIAEVTRFEMNDEYSCRIAGEVKNFHPEDYMSAKQAKHMDFFTKYAVATAKALMENSGFEIPKEKPNCIGVLIGCGLGGLGILEQYHTKLLKGGPKRVSPFFIPMLIGNMAAGQVAIFTGAKGPNLAATSACASGAHAIGYAFTDIRMGRVDAMICGGTESTITPLAFAGFCSMKATSSRNDDPEKASRPFDRDRDGFVMGEGCGLLLLESLDHARARGANILAEVTGFGASGDAYHMTAPDENGEGMSLAMQAALDDAGVAPQVVEHINAHGTSTPLNDACETKAIKHVFKEHAKNLPICSNKSQFGHLLGAAGGVESAIAILTLKYGIIPATINLENPDPICDLDYVPNVPRQQQVNNVLINSFGFGGTNASLFMQKFVD